MLTIAIFLFILMTINLWTALQLTAGPVLQVNVLAYYQSWLNTVNDVVSIAIRLIVDLVLLYRCWMVWDWYHLHTYPIVDCVSDFGNPSPILRQALRIHKECKDIVVCKHTTVQICDAVLWLQHGNKHLCNFSDRLPNYANYWNDRKSRPAPDMPYPYRIWDSLHAYKRHHLGGGCVCGRKPICWLANFATYSRGYELLGGQHRI